MVLVTLAATIPLTVCITLWCKKRCGKGRGRLGRTRGKGYQLLQEKPVDVILSDDDEGVERDLYEGTVLPGHRYHGN